MNASQILNDPFLSLEEKISALPIALARLGVPKAPPQKQKLTLTQIVFLEVTTMMCIKNLALHVQRENEAD